MTDIASIDELIEDETDEPELSPLRSALVWGLPALFTIGWIIYVLAFGHVGRVIDNWRTSLTMVFGSFVAGSTPQGGGAVAFPVFTKVLAIPAPVARSFSLSIQASGMMMASASILLSGRKVDWKALSLGVSGGGIGFLLGLAFFGNPLSPFWEPRISPAYVKVAFTIAIFAVAIIVWLCKSKETKHDEVQDWGPRSIFVMSVFALIGGVFSSLTGSGTDVLLFVFIVLVADVSTKVAIPTSIISMALVSVLGFAILGVWQGQLNIDLNAAGDQVVAVGGEAFGPESATRFDLFGIWIAAAPIVVWGAPLGAWVAAKVSEKLVIRFVATMAMLEVITTAVFLEDLRTDMVLVAFFVLGLVAIYFVVQRLDRLSGWIMKEPVAPVRRGARS